MITEIDSDLLAESGFRKRNGAIDFDGVLHYYEQAPVAGQVPGLNEDDAPVDGAIDWLLDVARYFYVVIYSAYANTEERQLQIATWLTTHGFFGIPYTITNEKPIAHWYLDDRGINFGGPGTFPSVQDLLRFRPWWAAAPNLVPIQGDTPVELAEALAARAAEMEPITTHLLEMAQNQGDLVGTENRLKTLDSLAEKIATKADEGDISLIRAAQNIRDSLRYSLAYQPSDYVESVEDALAELETHDQTVYRLRNYWRMDLAPSVPGSEGTFLGINVVLEAPNGFAYEVQFHTPQTYAINQSENWDLYQQSLAPGLSDADREAIWARMRENLADVERPDGVESVLWPGALLASVRRRRARTRLARGSGLVAAGMLPSVSLDHHNAVLAKATARAEKLEGRLAALLEPILAEAGRKAAAAFRARATDHLAATGLALVSAGDVQGADVRPTSTMVAVKPRPEEAARIALTDPESLHVTLAYLGDVEGDLDAVVEALRPVAASYAPLAGVVGGVGIFGSPGEDGPIIALPDVPGLVELRVAATEALIDAGVEYGREHGFLAHLTVAYRAETEGEIPPSAHYRPAENPGEACATCGYFDAAWSTCRMFDAPAQAAYVCDEWTDETYDPFGEELHFDSLVVVRGDQVEAELPLVGVPALTAAGTPPDWTAPAGDEVVDVDSLVQQIREKTDPVRQAMVETTMTPALRAAGLSFSVTNPLTAKVLAGAGAKVTNIAETTRLNVMRTIRAAYDNGLSIPQTASVIREGMASAAPARATMIARTELAGAVNGGSLAATEIVSTATGDSYEKTWLTAPGAKFPRHEEYDGLDGQTQPLDAPFDVGGFPLMYPGDPDGEAGEVINCRCTIIYGSPEGEQQADADQPPDLEEGGGGGGALQLGPPEGDDVSVDAGPPVPADMVAQIQTLGLDRPLEDLTPTTDVGRAVYARAGSTQTLYSTGGEWTAERAALHDRIVAAHFEGKDATGPASPTAYFTAGGGASGKSKALFDLAGKDVGLEQLAARSDVVHIDPDRIKAMLPEYRTLKDADDFYAAQGVHEESSVIAKRITEEAQRRGLSTIIDTTGSSSSFAQKLDAARAAGYDVRVTMFSTPTNEAIARSVARGNRSGRYVAIQALKRAHAGASRNAAIWKDSPGVREWRIYDNSGPRPELVADGGGGKANVYDQAKYDAILAKANER
jgi:2'-5' RNA ligase/predicted ABC-type ATPase